jgi:hypothetical protein
MIIKRVLITTTTGVFLQTSLFAQNNLIGLQIGETVITRDNLKKPVFFSQISFGYEGKLSSQNIYWNGNLGLNGISFDYQDTLLNSKYERVTHLIFPTGIRKYSVSRVGNAKGGTFLGIGISPNILLTRTVETRRDIFLNKKTDYFSGFNISFFGEVGHRFFLSKKWAIDLAFVIQQDLLFSNRNYATDVSKMGLHISFARRTKDNIWEKK